MGGRERAMHVDIPKHFTHEAVQNGHLRLSTSKQLADIFTKGLHAQPWAACQCVKSILFWEVGKSVRDVDPHEGSSGGEVLQVESRRPLRGVSGRVLEAKARVRY